MACCCFDFSPWRSQLSLRRYLFSWGFEERPPRSTIVIQDEIWHSRSCQGLRKSQSLPWGTRTIPACRACFSTLCPPLVMLMKDVVHNLPRSIDFEEREQVSEA